MNKLFPICFRGFDRRLVTQEIAALKKQILSLDNRNRDLEMQLYKAISEKAELQVQLELYNT